MKTVAFFLLLFALSSCNNENKNREDSKSELGDPAKVQPPSDAITDSTRIVNDSVIVPDTQPR